VRTQDLESGGTAARSEKGMRDWFCQSAPALRAKSCSSTLPASAEVPHFEAFYMYFLQTWGGLEGPSAEGLTFRAYISFPEKTPTVNPLTFVPLRVFTRLSPPLPFRPPSRRQRPVTHSHLLPLFTSIPSMIPLY
jgi:hypothetical protein